MPKTVHEGDLSTYPERFLRCRGDKQHTWRLETDKKILRNAAGRIIEFTRTKVCILCEMKRTTKVEVTKSGRFKPHAHQYEAPDGYSVRRTNALSPDAVRDAMFLHELQDSIPTADLERLISKRPVRRKTGGPQLRVV